MFLRKFLNKKNLVNIFNKFKNYEIYGLTKSLQTIAIAMLFEILLTAKSHILKIISNNHEIYGLI